MSVRTPKVLLLIRVFSYSIYLINETVQYSFSDLSFSIFYLFLLFCLSCFSLQLQRLIQLPGDQVLPTLCTDDWSEYFAVGPTVDLNAVKSYVCSTNWTAVYHELITDLEIRYIESQVGLLCGSLWE